VKGHRGPVGNHIQKGEPLKVGLSDPDQPTGCNRLPLGVS
jgi:hypothetical protein